MNQSVLAPTHRGHAHTFVPGDRLQGRYCMVRQLGAGGMGAVYEAIDERLLVTVAVKETFAVDSRLRWQFEQEARLLAQLSHPALPRVSDYFTEDGRAFLVMQFVAGDDLAEIITQQPGPLPYAQVIAWADQLLDALIYLHTRERQIIHRDIKPHNLKVTDSGQIALLDFGLAKTHSADQSSTQTSQSIFGYTRRYSPLEQIQDEGTSPQSDIYALGATLYHLLTGIRPSDALSRAAALANSKADPLLRANEVYPVVGSDLSAALDKALALDSSDRYQTAKEFREALSAVGRTELGHAHYFAAVTETSRLPALSASDPFEAYSILKPNDMSWATPRRSWSIPAMICGVGVLAVLAFIGSSFVSFAPDAERAVTDSVKAAASKNPGLTPTVRESRLERPRPSASESPTPQSTHDANSGNEKQKRNGKRVPAPSEPPVPSLGPALRVPAQ